MTATIDDRIRALVARIEELAPCAPELDLVPMRAAARGGRRATRRPLVAGALAVVLVFGALILVAAVRHTRHSAVPAPFSPRSTATELPDGYRLERAAIGTVEPTPWSGISFHLYATDAAPLGPALAAVSGSWSLTPVDPVEVVLTDGRRAVLADSGLDGIRWIDVEVAPGRWAGALARGIADAELQVIGTHLVSDAAGNATLVDPVALGFTDAGTVAPGEGRIFSSPSSTPLDGVPAGSYVSGYGPGDGSIDTTILAAPADAATRAQLALFAAVDASDVAGTYVVDLPADGIVGAYQEVDGWALYASSDGASVTTADLIAMLASMEPSDSWRADGTWIDADGSAPAETDLPATTASSATPNGDVPIDVQYDLQRDGGSTVGSWTAPDGTTITFEARFAGRSLTVEPSIDGERSDVPVLTAMSGAGRNGSCRCEQGAAIGYLLVVSEDDPATTLRVVVDGQEYRVPLVVLDPTYPDRVAVFVLPPSSGTVTAEILDADGNVQSPF